MRLKGKMQRWTDRKQRWRRSSSRSHWCWDKIKYFCLPLPLFQVQVTVLVTVEVTAEVSISVNGAEHRIREVSVHNLILI